MVGNLVWSLDMQVADPIFHVNQHFDRMLHHAIRIYGGIVPSGGPNCAIKASAYCSIGGVKDLSDTGEDVELSRRLFDFRRGSAKHIPCDYAGSHSRLVTSSRRAKVAFENKIACSLQWMSPNTAFELEGDQIRRDVKGIKNSSDNLLVCKDELEEVLNRTWHAICSLYPSVPLHRKGIAASLDLLKIDYKINETEKRIVVTNTDRYAEAYKKWRDKTHELTLENSGRTGLKLA
jgi:hypothetical protein